jgi:hypothetical protein
MVQTKEKQQLKASVLNSLKKLDPNKLKQVVTNHFMKKQNKLKTQSTSPKPPVNKAPVTLA